MTNILHSSKFNISLTIFFTVYSLELLMLFLAFQIDLAILPFLVAQKIKFFFHSVFEAMLHSSAKMYCLKLNSNLTFLVVHSYTGFSPVVCIRSYTKSR